MQLATRRSVPLSYFLLTNVYTVLPEKIHFHDITVWQFIFHWLTSKTVVVKTS